MSTQQSEVNIREVAPNVWIFSAPFTRSGFMPIGARTTAIKLKNGGVWLLPSTPLDEPTKTKINELGTVEYILSADAEHHIVLADYHAAYPQAKLIANETVVEAESKKGLHFVGVFGKDAPGTKYGFEDEIQHKYFSGHRKGDVVYFHPASRSIILQDLLFNQPPKGEVNESYENSDQSGHIPLQENIFAPSAYFHKLLSSLTGKDKDVMKQDVEAVNAWDFDRIITCHGNVIETGGKEAWKSAFENYL